MQNILARVVADTPQLAKGEVRGEEYERITGNSF
jgi:hypothetical protein